jgi:hypothetical protein
MQFKHKFNEGDIVIHTFHCPELKKQRQDRAKIVGYCLEHDWATEARYGIELLDRKYQSERYSGMSSVYVEYKIVKAVGESEIELESPKEEKSVAEQVAEISDPTVAPSGV